MAAAAQHAARTAGQKKRHASVVVKIRIAHRGTVQQQRAIEKRALPVRDALQLLEQIRNHADVIRVESGKVENLRLLAAVMRCAVEGAVEAALRVRAVGVVASELECKYAGHIRRERQHLEIEHQLYVL